tara:strand:+ start:5762 stop:6268 length:507 start_codon:yes stop_codon:yes gene_type:complete
MLLFKSKKTNKLTNLDKKNILILKNEFWKRGIKSQKEWFKSNIRIFDIHNLLFFKRKLIGYTCLRYRSKLIKKKFSKYLLFDTLIVSKTYRKKGIGSVLMSYNNTVILNHNLPSFLVCEKKTIEFYKKNRWKLLKDNLFLIKDETYNRKFGMIFNCIPKNKIQLWVNK